VEELRGPYHEIVELIDMYRDESRFFEKMNNQSEMQSLSDLNRWSKASNKMSV